MTGRVVVVGSLNADTVATVARHPRPGETVLGDSLRRLPGGKGANQAVAAAAAGARVALVGCVGDDPDGAAYERLLQARGVDVAGLRRVAQPTGTAIVVVSRDGENAIVVVPGANAALTADDVTQVAVGPGDVVLVQLEVPIPVVAAAVEHAVRRGARAVVNVAPYADLPEAVLAAADPVVANEAEAGALAGPPPSLVTTLGARGARWVRGDRVVDVRAPSVDVVDTTGAGDVFAGTLAAALVNGAPEEKALRTAVNAAARSVTVPGAQGGATLDGF